MSFIYRNTRLLYTEAYTTCIQGAYTTIAYRVAYLLVTKTNTEVYFVIQWSISTTYISHTYNAVWVCMPVQLPIPQPNLTHHICCTPSLALSPLPTNYNIIPSTNIADPNPCDQPDPTSWWWSWIFSNHHLLAWPETGGQQSTVQGHRLLPWIKNNVSIFYSLRDISALTIKWSSF